MEFAGLDDELFLEERRRGSVDQQYTARRCPHAWFTHVPPEDLVSDEDRLNVIKFQAEYLFLRKDYDQAIKKYEEVLASVAEGCVTVRRECYEGIVRSHINRGTAGDATAMAVKLHETSKTVEQMTVSYSVLVDLYLSAGKLAEALSAGQMLVTLHTFTSNAWLRLAMIYAAMHGISIPTIEAMFRRVKPHIDDSCDLGSLSTILTNEGDADEAALEGVSGGAQLVAACLLRALLLLKKTEGTAVGFALDNSLVYQKNILNDLLALMDHDMLCHLRKIAMANFDLLERKSGCTNEEYTEFVDRGSSKFKNEEPGIDVKTLNHQNFEKCWFHWIK